MSQKRMLQIPDISIFVKNYLSDNVSRIIFDYIFYFFNTASLMGVQCNKLLTQTGLKRWILQC